MSASNTSTVGPRTQRVGSDVREIRLEGLGLALFAVLLLAAGGGVFWLGRAYERFVSPPTEQNAAMPRGGGSGAPLTQGNTEVGEGDIFDQARDDSLEPSRQVQRADPRDATTTPRPTPRPGSPGAVSADGGNYWVQVFAGRDQSAAASLVGRLESGGHDVKLVTEREGSRALYKVRVGGFSSRTRAERAAAALKSDGYTGAWVTP